MNSTFLKLLSALLGIASTMLSADHYFAYGKKKYLQPLEKNSTTIARDYFSNPNILYYQKSDSPKIKSRAVLKNNKGDNIANNIADNVVGIDGHIWIKFKKNISQQTQQQLIKQYQLQTIKKPMPNLWLVHTPNVSQTLSLSNSLYAETITAYAHPDFHIKLKRRAIKKDEIADPLFDKSWHLKKNDSDDQNPAINIQEIFKITKGFGVKVGIFDDALDSGHKDLKANIKKYVDGRDTSRANPPYSIFSGFFHGTRMAGIIASAQNDTGSIGIAPQSGLYFVGHHLSTTDDVRTRVSEIIGAFNWFKAQSVDLISNAWGTYDADPALEDVITHIAKTGREGKGLPIVFASGNNGISLDDEDINDESEIEAVISVGSVSYENPNEMAYFSNYGKNVDMLTVGEEIITTCPDGRYCTSTGTSPSSAITSGIIALMLSVDATLTKDAIKNILQQSTNLAVTHNGITYPVINANRAIDTVISQQSIESIEKHLIKNSPKKISGYFTLYDFDDKPDHLDWVYVKEGDFYLMMDNPHAQNRFGFTKITPIKDLSPKYYLVNRFLDDSFSSPYWVIVDAKTKAVRRVKSFEADSVVYQKLSIKGEIDGNHKSVTFFKNQKK